MAGEPVPAGFAEQVAPACGLAQLGLELVGQLRSAGLSLSARAAIIFLRAAAFAAFAISGWRAAKNSCSWSLTRSQGGLPMTQEKPPAQPVAGSMSVAPLPTRKMCGNSTCQWKKRYWRVRSMTRSSAAASSRVPASAAELFQDRLGDRGGAGDGGLRLHECGAPGVGEELLDAEFG